MKKPRVKYLILNCFQNGTEMLQTVSNVSKVYDEVEREQARLYNPFIITLSKTPVQLVYPYYYRGVSSRITSTGSPQRERGGKRVRRMRKLVRMCPLWIQPRCTKSYMSFLWNVSFRFVFLPYGQLNSCERFLSWATLYTCAPWIHTKKSRA